MSLRGVGRRFAAPGGGTRTVLAGVDLDIREGEIVALLGPSGCGKSTLLRLVGGLDAPDEGSVALGRRPVAAVDQRCAVAFQEPRLLPWRTIERNVRLGLPHGTEREAGRARVAELLRLVQLDAAAGLRPRQVSGGMAQRASLARALARNPGVLLLDEPFGALDALTRLTMQDLLLDIHRAEPATVLLVTHDVDEALALADRVVLLGADPARPDAGAGIRALVEIPGERPRDRADSRLADLRAELLEGLGVPSHHRVAV
ncbi:ABC transporter ATP-binding protein [Homoserinibacter sp. YIM 151385]|nr:ABC transporter ATP-binding protein [Homoserinibacter sp. YIM 151385]WBU39340.1 ABC transporter ATP-binding protein [Homoserinibacter sp. YIM 151385]